MGPQLFPLPTADTLKTDTVDPTVNDDINAGFSIGQHWINTTTDKGFECMDNAAGAAVWVETTAGGGGGGWTVVTEATAARSAAVGEFVLVNAATCVVTLPAPAADARVAVKVITGTVTSIEVRTSGAGIDIDGTDYSLAGLALVTQYEQISLASDGSDWWIY